MLATAEMTAGRNEAARIVGGLAKLKRLIASGEIDAVKPKDAQNGKWRCNLSQVLLHARTKPKINKSNSKKS
ncbi:MAG: hypothetical protein IJR86_08200 [Bacteroidaceae bacterium]|nr:hypothetical protein [Bacteroidaceae bacterium]